MVSLRAEIISRKTFLSYPLNLTVNPIYTKGCDGKIGGSASRYHARFVVGNGTRLNYKKRGRNAPSPIQANENDFQRLEHGEKNSVLR